MANDRSTLERQMQRVELRPFTLEGFHRRRHRKERNRRIGTAVVALGVAAAGIGGVARAFLSGPETRPTDQPASPFVGTWVTTDPDGSTPTMVISASGGEAFEIVVHDDLASVCAGAPSTMTGAGRLVDPRELVIPSPALTCDDGSEPEALSGPPLEEQLRNMTFVHDREADTLTDNLGSVWDRGKTPEPSGGMWPQSSLEKVREAQELADAGDPRYTWQVDPELAGQGDPGDAEIVARFLREELGWEEFTRNPFAGSNESGEGTVSGVVFIRCEPGETNPLYPNDHLGGGCAPTIDKLRSESVQIDLAQPVRRGPSGIWVVTRWVAGRFEQAVPPSDADASALVEAFLRARVDGEGAEENLETPEEDIPLMYDTTAGAPYERYEFELVDGPEWPGGSMEYKVRLFAEGGKTVVEQPFLVYRIGAGDLELDYGSLTTYRPVTTENGQPVALPYEFLDGEVTFEAAPPWDHSIAGWEISPTMTTLRDNHDGRLAVLADPRPIETGCVRGPVPRDAEALARSLRSDPDLEATEAVTAEIGGVQALRMDAVAATSGNLCDEVGVPEVVSGGTATGLEPEQRMRLYLLDYPAESARVLAIAIAAPEERFQRVLESAAPIVESFRFHTR
jgi:hypothetical protein